MDRDCANITQIRGQKKADLREDWLQARVQQNQYVFFVHFFALRAGCVVTQL